nr:MAG TPA: hypothetical protein [Caudoviricetes sp.]
MSESRPQIHSFVNNQKNCKNFSKKLDSHGERLLRLRLDKTY